MRTAIVTAAAVAALLATPATAAAEPEDVFADAWCVQADASITDPEALPPGSWERLPYHVDPWGYLSGVTPIACQPIGYAAPEVVIVEPDVSQPNGDTPGRVLVYAGPGEPDVTDVAPVDPDAVEVDVADVAIETVRRVVIVGRSAFVSLR